MNVDDESWQIITWYPQIHASSTSPRNERYSFWAENGPKLQLLSRELSATKIKVGPPWVAKNTEAENLWKFNLQTSSKFGSFIQYTFPFLEGILKNALCILGHQVAGASAEDEMWLGGVEMNGYLKYVKG